MTDIVEHFAECEKGLVVAPAGCGKTHLIGQAVRCSTGRQLVLTHTHAGVRAIRNHLRKQGVSSSRYRVSTIDAFALRYVNSFSQIAGKSFQQPSGEDWKLLHPVACRAFAHPAIGVVIKASYAGLFVDEYQDCTTGQHQIIQALADWIPARVVGDPLQAIFGELNRENHCAWAHVEAFFPLVGELRTPHRWIDKNDALGSWLLTIRRNLEEGLPIDLRVSPIVWKHDASRPSQLSTCFGLVNRDRESSSLAIRKWPRECCKLARSLKGTYGTIEPVECKDLIIYAESIETQQGVDRVQRILKLAEECIANIPSAILNLKERFAAGKVPKPRRSDFANVVHALESVNLDNSACCVGHALDSIDQLNAPLVYSRRGLWRYFRRAVADCEHFPDCSLSESAWKVLSRTRHVGRRIDRCSISTTLLVKGLEFDHAAVLNADELDTAESIYVALTRASKSLTIHSTSATIQRPKPQYANTLAMS